MRVPNAVTLPGIPIGLLVCAVANGGRETVVRLVVIAALMAVYYTGLIAGGDTKLLMTLTALNGALPMLLSLLAANVVMILHWFFKDRDETERAMITGWLLLLRPDRMRVIRKREGKRVAFALYLLIGCTAVELSLFVVSFVTKTM